MASKFVLLLKGEQERSAVNQRMDQLLLLLSQSYDTKDASNLNNPNIISINASIGIAFFPYRRQVTSTTCCVARNWHLAAQKIVANPAINILTHLNKLPSSIAED